jgi:hypothetical protein
MTGPVKRFSIADMLRADQTLREELAGFDTGRSFLEAAQRAETAPDPEPTSLVLTATPATIQAAMSHTFQLEEVGATTTDRDALLTHSAVVMIDGRRRLRLSDEARGRLIDDEYRSPQFREALNAALAADTADFDAIAEDEVRRPSAWLRSFLIGRYGDILTAPPREVRSAATARECLRLVTTLTHTLPDVIACRRAVERAELLEPLRILIGAAGGWDGRPEGDRFVGRASELATLRAFVDELASEGLVEMGARALGRATRVASRLVNQRAEGPLVIVGGGGLGKSTLMAKFVLDHALAPGRPFPFAYLDFDRAALQPREGRKLLVEVARQVALQFPAMAPALDELRRKIRETFTAPTGAGSDDALFDQFRDLVRQHATLGSRAFLLVFDTAELVQSDAEALRGVVTFVRALIGPSFPELRLVVAGRAEVPELTLRTEKWNQGRVLTLAPLSLGDAREMANRLGKSLLKNEWNETWADRIVGGSSDRPLQREPLAVRVSVEFLRAAPPDRRESRAREIESMREQVTDDFVGRLYERRVLDHIRNPDARKLAWPGLVVRRLTRDLATRVLAPLCDLAADRVPEAFEALAREVWIVEREGDDVLRHRPDLRSRTLPLMRQRNGELFAEIARKVAEYYGEPQRRDAARGEWLYHRLLAGESPMTVDRDWTDAAAVALVDAGKDFEPTSPAAAYLSARTESRLLPRERIAQLPIALAWDHVARTGASLRRFDDERVNPLILDLVGSDERLGNEVWTLRPDARATRHTLLIKSGRWAPVLNDDGLSDEGDDHKFAGLYLTARADEGDGRLPVWLRDLLDQAVSPSGDVRVRLPALVEVLAIARRRGLPVANAIDTTLARAAPEIARSPASFGSSALRTAIILGDRCAAALGPAWLSLVREAGADAMTSVSVAELALFMKADVISVSLVQEHLPGWIDLKSLSGPDPVPARVMAQPAVDAVLAALGKLVDAVGTSARARGTLRRFLAVRHVDWIVPMGYAVSRALGPAATPEPVVERLLTYVRGPATSFLSRLGRPSPPTVEPDGIDLLRAADLASDLRGVARLVLGLTKDATAARDLEFLLASLESWKRFVAETINRDEASAR